MEEKNIRQGAKEALAWPEEGGENRTDGGGETYLLSWDGGEREVGLEELMALARKGLDYDSQSERLRAALRRVEELERGAPLTREERRRRDCARFLEEFPQAASELLAGGRGLPREVWARVRAGEGLAEAYGDYARRAELARRDEEIARLRREAEELRRERANAERSTGSSRSRGEGLAYDPVSAGWNSV